MGKVTWNGAVWLTQFERAMLGRTKGACIFLAREVKADISQSGVLQYAAKPGSKRQKRVYNFTHSRPGNPPFKQTGNLRRSVAWDVTAPGMAGLTWGKIVGRVGVPWKYGLYLEKGTKRMAARPYLSRNFRRHQMTIGRMLTGRMKPGELPALVSNQSRSGHFGQGARKAGWA